VAIALDPGAELAPVAVGLLVDTIGQLAARVGKVDGAERRLRVVTTDPHRLVVLETGERLTLTALRAGEQNEPAMFTQGSVVLPAAALIGLVYGRLDREHTPPIDTHQVDLDQLRRMFPGF
jgi:hypothetical protein